MKSLVLSAVIFTATFPAFGGRYETFSPNFSAKTQIFWRAPTNRLPESFWVYQKVLPRVFSASTISNAMALTPYEDRGIRPSTNETCIFDDPDCNCPCGRFCNFSISPGSASIYYSSPGQNILTQAIPADETIATWTWRYARQMGVDTSQVVLKDLASRFNTDTNGNKIPGQISGRGAFLARVIDGTPYIGNGNDGFICEGFWMEFGSYGIIRDFDYIWPGLKRATQSKTALPGQIIACLRAREVIVIPEEGETNYFGRIKNLSKAKALTINKITPYYNEGTWGEMPTNDETPKIVAPLAVLDAVADFGSSNAPVRLYSPILTSDIARLASQNEE